MPGCWREGGQPGLECDLQSWTRDPGDLDKIFLVRETGDAADAHQGGGTERTRGAVRGAPKGVPKRPSLEFFVKFKSIAHIHCQWVPQADLEVDPINKRRVAKFLKDLGESREEAPADGADGLLGFDGGGLTSSLLDLTGSGLDREIDEREAFNPEYREVDRIIDERPSPVALPPEFLVKWRGLNYSGATWESCRTLINHQHAIRAFRARQRPPPPAEVAIALRGYRPPASHFRPFAESPTFCNDNRLHPHQLDGLNWLLFSYYSSRSVMLADEMGMSPARTTAMHHAFTPASLSARAARIR